MKQRLKSGYKTLAIIFLFLAASVFAFSQKQAMHIASAGNSFFVSPWVWLAVAAVCVLLLAAVMKSENSSSKEA